MKTGGHCNLVIDGCSVDAATAAALSGLDIVSSSKEERRSGLFLLLTGFGKGLVFVSKVTLCAKKDICTVTKLLN